MTRIEVMEAVSVSTGTATYESQDGYLEVSDADVQDTLNVLRVIGTLVEDAPATTNTEIPAPEGENGT